MRSYHAGNMDVPDFTYYRRSVTKDPTSKNSDSVQERMGFSYVMAGGMGIGGAYGAKSLVNQFISTWSASQDVLAMSKIEIKLADIPEGEDKDDLCVIEISRNSYRQEHDLQVERQATFHPTQNCPGD